MNNKKPMRLAHRGLVRKAPENTLEAIEAAYELGCEGVEIDIRSTRDGRIVLIHDADIVRITSGGPDDGRSERVAELDWEEVARLSFPYANHLLPELPAEGVPEEALYPRLAARQLGREQPHAEAFRMDPRVASPLLFEELLAWCLGRERPITIEVECKESGLVPGLQRVFDRVGGGERCILFSGEAAVVEELCAGFPRTGRGGDGGAGGTPTSPASQPAVRRSGVRVGANVRRLTPGGLEEIERLGLDVVDLNAFEVSREEVASLRRAGYRVLANLGDLPEWWQVLEEWGFDGFKTNYAEEYTAWASSPRARPASSNPAEG